VSGVGSPTTEIGPVKWQDGDTFTLAVTLTVHLGKPPHNWVRAEGDAKDAVRRRFREAREALHQGRPR
jgi:hypothetical protein